MSLHNLLQNVAHGLTDRGVQQGYEYCHVGHGMCARCPVEHNKRRCPLSDDEYLEKWATMHVGQIWADPKLWAERARDQIEQFENPAMMMFAQMTYDLPLEGPEMVYWKAQLDKVLAAWTDKGWLARFAEQAHEREARNPMDTTLTDIAEIVDAVLALSDSLAEPMGVVNT